MGKRIMILGGAGLIGTHLCLRLLSEGNEVFCIDIRNVADSRLLAGVRIQNNFRYIRHNITDTFDTHCDEIYNLTAPIRLLYNHDLPVETLKINVLGAINTLEVARNRQAKVLYASSGDIYRSPYREDTQDEGNCYSQKYILTEGKRAGESLHRAYHNEYGVDTRIARLFNTYGPGASIDDQHVVMKMIVAALRNRDIPVYGSGEQMRTFCWVGDVTDGLMRLMQAPPSPTTRTINLGGTHEISIQSLAEKIISITGSRSKITHTPTRYDDPRRRVPDLTATRQELDWIPVTPLLEGLKRTAEYVETELARSERFEMSWVEMNV